jgi:hypothetical protein
MIVASATRLRLRSWRFLPSFVPSALRSARQARVSPGFLGGAILAERQLAFWTLTLWESEGSLRGYTLAGAHREAMPRLVVWCDEAAVARWEKDDAVLPSWAEVDRQMRQDGRASRVRFPSQNHAGLTHPPPVTGANLPLRRRTQ